ncbi:unnamed protein product [Discosporangium mesarthrocarpum]
MDTNAESLPQDPVQDSSIQRGVGWGSSTGKDNRNDLSRNNLAWLSASRAGEAANVEADAGDERFAATRNYETPQAAHGFFSSLDAGGDSTDSEAEDARVCPGLLYSCCPCLRCMRPKRQRTRDGSMVKGRSQLSLTTPLLRSDSSDNDRNLRERELPKDVKLIEVELVSARDLPAGDPEIKASNAYVQVRVLPLQDGVGEQAKQSSVIVGTCNPRWGNGQAFTFFVTNQSNASLLFSVMHRIHNSRGPLQASAGLALGVRRSAYTDIPLGEGMVDILQLFPGHSSSRVRAGQDGRAVAGRRVSVVLRDPTTKRRTASTLQLNLRCRYVNEILHTTDHRIYEHQYWSKVAGWMAIDRTTKGKCESYQ